MSKVRKNVWFKPNGNKINLNEDPRTEAHAKALGWKKQVSDDGKKTEESKKSA